MAQRGLSMRFAGIIGTSLAVCAASGCAGRSSHALGPETLLRASQAAELDPAREPPAASDTANAPPDSPGARSGPESARSERSGVRFGPATAPEATGGPPSANAEPSPPAPLPEVAHAFQAAIPGTEGPPDAFATRAANLSPAACKAELTKRGLKVAFAKQAVAGVATPLRLPASVHGVRVIGSAGTSPYGVLDCRLALVVDELAQILAKHDVVAVRADNFYRKRARLPGKKAKSQHAYGLAIDVTGFVLKDGRTLEVERDWHGAVGEPACGPSSAPDDPTPGTIALRDLVCDLFRAGLFHHVLTPGFDLAHRNHLHLDIKRGEPRFIVR